MTFLNPWAFLGLLVVPVIIGLHLLLERNRRVIVSSMFLWAFLDAKFEGEKPKHIQLSWLLLLDILIAILLSLAFAKPVISLPTLGGEAVHRMILIDDSTSMLALDGDLDRLSLAKDIAVNLIQESRQRDEVTVITLGGEPELLGSTVKDNIEVLVNSVESLESLGTGTDLRGGLAMALSNANVDLPMEIFIITDAAFEMVDAKDFPVDVQWVFVGFDRNNQAVIEPILDDRKNNSELFFQLVNYDVNQVERGVEILVNQELVSQEQVFLSPMSVQPNIYFLTGEVDTVEIRLRGQDILPIDDVAYLSNVENPIVDVALVTEFPDPINRAISAVPSTNLTVFHPLDYSPTSNFDLVIFRGVFPDSWPTGIVIMFDPPEGDEKLNILSLEEVSAPIEVNSHQVLQGIDLSGIRWEYAWNVSEDSHDEKLVYANKVPLLISQKMESGEIFFFLSQLSSGNFTKHPSFPILMASMVNYSREYSPDSTYLLGESILFDNGFGSNQTELIPPSNETLTPADGQVTVLDEIGFYSLSLTDSYGDRLYQFGVNAGDFIESNIFPREWRFLYSIENDGDSSDLQTIDVDLSPWLLLVVAILLVLEAIRAWR